MFVSAYEAAARSAALDSIRGLLPVGVLLSKGFRGNGVAWENLLNKMYASNLFEMQQLGLQTKHELDYIIPELVSRVEDEKGAASQQYLRKIKEVIRRKGANLMLKYDAGENPRKHDSIYEG